jgi:hypothetical protein
MPRPLVAQQPVDRQLDFRVLRPRLAVELRLLARRVEDPLARVEDPLLRLEPPLARLELLRLELLRVEVLRPVVRFAALCAAFAACSKSFLSAVVNLPVSRRASVTNLPSPLYRVLVPAAASRPVCLRSSVSAFCAESSD